jgi:DNA-directed RNA polymerase specialized sigma24 family protein
MNTAPECGDCTVSASELLAAITGSAATASKIYRRVFPRLRRLARRHAPSLPPDLHDEIVQETWLLVVRRGAEVFVDAGATADVYLAMVLRNAVEVVKANNRPAGTPSRPTPTKTAAVAVDLDNGVENGASMAQFRSERIETEIRLDIALFAAKAEPQVARALALMLDDGLPISSAASGVGMSRQTLYRRLIGLRQAA